MKRLLKNTILVMMFISMSLFVMSGEREEKQENPLVQLTKISMVQAQKTALAKAPGKIMEGGLEIENGLLVYSFDIRTGKEEVTEVQINAKDGKVVVAKKETMREETAEEARDGKKVEASEKGETGEGLLEKAEHAMERVTGEEGDREEPIHGTINVKKYFHLKKLAKVNEGTAQKAALKLVEGTVKEAELENEDGFLVYNVSVMYHGQEWEVLVDAGNGMVLKVDTED